MLPAGDSHLGRYRRRILGWGSAVLVATFVVGATVAEPQVEDDLEGRVVAEFNEAGIGPVTISFSGQDGTLGCRSGPVDIPADLLARVRALWGVESISVDSSCRPPADVPTTTAPATTTASTSTTSGEAPVVTDPPATTEPAATTVPPPDIDDVGTVIANDSQFSTLDGLIGDAGLDDTVNGDGPLTFVAPTNEAFQELGPDIVAALGRDPELLATVLRHHIAPVSLRAAEFADGEIDMLDGTPVLVATDGGVVSLTSGTAVATIVEADLMASNGVVHAIDAVLVPADLVVGVAAGEPLVTAALADGRLVLTGTVATEEQRDLIVTAAGAGLDPVNVSDEITVDPASPVGDVERFATLVAALPTGLTTAEASITGAGLVVRGTYVDEDGRESIVSVVDSIEASIDDGSSVIVELAPRPAATAASAAVVEADLNALVGASPILFEPASAEISDESAAVLDRAAAVIQRVGGLAVEIVGHTDTDGTAANNLLLSEARAQAVLAALVNRGVDAEILGAVGRGGTEPILDADGVEDKAASRRVEFVVSVG